MRKKDKPAPITPDREDFEAVAAEYPSGKTEAELYRLAQAAKLVRLYEHGLLPADEMRAMDDLVRRKKDEFK